MAALDSITVKGFKSIASIEHLPIGQINVLIGANGSGKSNLIEVFSLLNIIQSGNLRNYISRSGGAENILHYGSKHTSKIVISISFENKKNGYHIELTPTKNDTLFPSNEVVYSGNNKDYQVSYDQPITSSGGEAAISDPAGTGSPITEYIYDHLNRWRIYHFHDTSSTSLMKRNADLNDNRILRPDGSNLAAFLYLLRERHKSIYSLIRRTIRIAAPFFRDFQLEPMALNEDKIRLEWSHRGSDNYFDASSLSDGTLRFMALTTLLLQPSRPSIIIMDEPELGLHPYAVTLLASLVKQAAKDTQIILATQSALLLDHFNPEDVLVADRIDGATGFNRLDPARLQIWLKEYSLGQLWEKNEFGGRPVFEP